MPNILNADGLQIQTSAEIVAELTEGLKAIYGDNINVEPNSPDGQVINLIAQAKLDVLELTNQVYTSFDPDEAIGTQLDDRVGINGIQRNPGTYTIQTVQITVDRALTLPGLDTAPLAPFTVSDGNGNLFYLLTTASPVAAGVADYVFRAARLGAVETIPNTISTIVTIKLGVVSVNNSGGATSTGIVEETDYALRIRRRNSVSLPSIGYFEGLLGALLTLDGVIAASLFENITGTTDGDGIPGHSIWVIVLGGTNADIAQTIYVKRNAGCGMKGSVTENVTQLDGSTFAVKFDRPTNEDLYIEFDVDPITGPLDEDYIREQLLERLSYGINEKADTTTIVSLVREIAPNASVSNEGVSDDDITYVPLLSTTGKNYQFIIASDRIKINGLVGP